MSDKTQDRELLEMAAKAAGFTLLECTCKVTPKRSDTGRHWSPLTDDGDALRLAVKLGIHLQFAMDYAVAYAGSVHAKQFTERCGSDQNPAPGRTAKRGQRAF